MIGLFQKKDKVWGDLTVLTHDLRDTLQPLLFCSQGYSETCFSCRLKAIWEDSGAEGSGLFLSFYCSFCQLDLHCCTCGLFNCFNPTSLLPWQELVNHFLPCLRNWLEAIVKVPQISPILVKVLRERSVSSIRQPTSWMKMPCQPPSNACKCDVDLAVAYWGLLLCLAVRGVDLQDLLRVCHSFLRKRSGDAGIQQHLILRCRTTWF